MKKSIILSAAMFGLGLCANAGVVYTDGPINGTINAYSIFTGYWTVTDSFTVTSATSLGSAVAGLWVDFGAVPVSLDWAVGTTPFASDISSGATGLANTFWGIGFDSFSIYNSSFNISGAVGPGTYWFTLSAGEASDGGNIFWDDNNGPSTGYQNGTGLLTGGEAFTLYSTGKLGVPDAATTSGLLGMALVGLGAIRRKLS